MKKLNGCILILAAVFLFANSCKKKKESSSGCTEQGTSQITLNLTGDCWTFDCSAGRDLMVAHCGSTTITMLLGSAPSTGSSTYNLTAGNPGPNQAKITIENMPFTLKERVWHSTSGTIDLYSDNITTTAGISNILCIQTASASPSMLLSGTLMCQ